MCNSCAYIQFTVCLILYKTVYAMSQCGSKMLDIDSNKKKLNMTAVFIPERSLDQWQKPSHSYSLPHQKNTYSPWFILLEIVYTPMGSRTIFDHLSGCIFYTTFLDPSPPPVECEQIILALLRRSAVAVMFGL